MIQVGDVIPDATLMETTEFGEACPLSPKPVSVAEALAGKRVVVFAHVPGYLEHLGDFKARGIDEVWCVSVNDAYVMAAWGREQGAIGKIRMLGDGNGELTDRLGLDLDQTKSGMGRRSKRYSMLIDNGVVKQLNIEQPGKFVVSNAETILGQLS